jgi:hypothetical protein
VGWLCSVATCAQVRANLVPNAEFHVDAHVQAPFWGSSGRLDLTCNLARTSQTTRTVRRCN